MAAHGDGARARRLFTEHPGRRRVPAAGGFRARGLRRGAARALAPVARFGAPGPDPGGAGAGPRCLAGPLLGQGSPHRLGPRRDRQGATDHRGDRRRGREDRPDQGPGVPGKSRVRGTVPVLHRSVPRREAP